jgi:predicted nucleic acid-binding protein
MNGNNLKTVYWDTGIFIAWLNTEKRDQLETANIEEQLIQFENKKLILCTSVITLLEILPSQLSYKRYQLFENLSARSNFQFINVDITVSTIARNIRDYYSKIKDASSTTITQPDAIHLASAINRNCDCFYTLDQADKKGRSRGLLPLSGSIAKSYYLRIERPGFGTFKI